MSDQENPARTWIGELLGFFFYVVYVNKLSLLTRLMHVLACACSSQSFTLWHMFQAHVWKIVLNLSIYWGRQLHCFVLVYTICQQILMTPHNMRRNTKRIVPISYHFSYVILFVRPMMMLTCMTPQIIVTN